MTEGRRQLRAVVVRDGVREVARRLRRSHAAVSFWCSGDRVPGYASRRVMLEVLGVPMEAWEADAVFTPVTTQTCTTAA